MIAQVVFLAQFFLVMTLAGALPLLPEPPSAATLFLLLGAAIIIPAAPRAAAAMRRVVLRAAAAAAAAAGQARDPRPTPGGPLRAARLFVLPDDPGVPGSALARAPSRAARAHA